MRSRLLAALALLILPGLQFACGGDHADACVVGLNLDCAMNYEPTFSEIHRRTLMPTCALAGGQCHAPDGAKNGLILDDADRAYQLLLDSRVKPGDPACSLMVERLESSDPAFMMPPGRQLSEGDRCVIRKWIQMGALR